jgi:hypothetical protein
MEGIMRTITILFLLLMLCLTPTAQAQQQNDLSPTALTDWRTPARVSGADWPDLRYVSFNDDATRLVGVDPWNSDDDRSHSLLVSEFMDGAWQTPTVIAQNGVYDTGGFIWMPQWSHPVLSGDGETIAYLGWTGTTHGVYVVDRLPGGGWSAPALVETGLGNIHYWISLSQDGRTLALASYSFGDTDHVYVTTRSEGGWSALTRVSAESGLIAGGHMPSLSADGRKLVYIQNARATFTEFVAGQWTAPVHVTSNNHWEGDEVEYPQMSGDGRAVIYWLVRNEGGTLTSQDLYVLRRAGEAWAAPEKVNTSANLPITNVSRAPAAANREATRIVYSRAIGSQDPELGLVVHASDLDIAEWNGASWQEAQLAASDGWTYNWWPRLTPDGMRLAFMGTSSWIWQMTTDTPPPVLPLPTSVAGLITPAGGALFSEIDQTRYLFPAGAFPEDVTFTHSVPPGPPPPPPPGLLGLPGVGGLGHRFEATALSAATSQPVQPTGPVTVTIDYSPDQLGPIIPGSLGLWWMDVDGWSRLPSQDDPVAGRLTATVDHFSLFALFGETHSLYLPGVQK